MASFGDFLSGASGGAMATLPTANPLLIGATALAGGLASLAGPSADEVRRRNFNELLMNLDTLQAETANRGFKALGGQVQKNMSAARQAATRRAAAMGRSSSAESFIAPVENRAQVAGGDALTGWWNQTQDQFTRAKMAGVTEFGSRPIEPSAGQFIQSAGQGIGQYLQNRDYISALREYGKTNPIMAPIPGSTGTSSSSWTYTPPPTTLPYSPMAR